MDNGIKILLVEDDQFIRDMFQDELKRVGFEVEAVGTGQSCLSQLESVTYDLLLLDIMLPDINGIEVLRDIRFKLNLKDLKVVMLTNLGQDSVIKQGFEFGATGYLIKSAYNPDQIVSEIRNFLEDNSGSDIGDTT